MDKQKMERANNIEYLLSELKYLEFWSRNENTTLPLENGLYHLCCRDKEFSGKFHQLISDTKKRLEKEFNEL